MPIDVKTYRAEYHIKTPNGVRIESITRTRNVGRKNEIVDVGRFDTKEDAVMFMNDFLRGLDVIRRYG